MKYLFLGFLLTYSISAVGQNHFFGLKGGIIGSNVSTDASIFSDRDNRIGFSGGLTYEYQFRKPHFIVGVDFLYVQKGFRVKKYFPDEGDLLGGNIEITDNYDYLSLPLKAGLIAGKKITGFIMLGLVPSYVVRAKSILSLQLSDGHKDETVSNFIDRVTKFDCAGLVEVGGDIKIKDRLLLFTSLAYQRSFTTITNSNYIPDNEVRHYNMTLSIGLKYALKHE